MTFVVWRRKKEKEKKSWIFHSQPTNMPSLLKDIRCWDRFSGAAELIGYTYLCIEWHWLIDGFSYGQNRLQLPVHSRALVISSFQWQGRIVYTYVPVRSRTLVVIRSCQWHGRINRLHLPVHWMALVISWFQWHGRIGYTYMCIQGRWLLDRFSGTAE